MKVTTSSVLHCIIVSLCLAVVWGWNRWTDTNEPNTPGPRAGHSMVVWNNRVYVFGGRANDASVVHNPKSYEIREVAGILEFTSYDGQSVRNCNVTDGTCNIEVGTYYNDLWAYDLSKW